MILENNLEYKNPVFLFLEIIIFSFLTAIIVNKLKIWKTLPFIIFLIISYYISAIYYFKNNLILDLVYVPLVILITYFITILFLFRNTQKSKGVFIIFSYNL